MWTALSLLTHSRTAATLWEQRGNYSTRKSFEQFHFNQRIRQAPTQALLLGGCQHWVSTPTKGDTALEGVDTYQRRYCLARCQHLARQYLLW